MKNISKITRKCYASGWITASPFLNYKHTMKRVDRVFLTTDKLQSIVDKSFAADRLTQVRDIFIFCCSTGLAFVDIQKLRYNTLSKGLTVQNGYTSTGRKPRYKCTGVPVNSHYLSSSITKIDLQAWGLPEAT